MSFEKKETSIPVHFIESDGEAVTKSGTQLSLYFKSKAVTQANVNVIYDSFQAYMTANGKQV